MGVVKHYLLIFWDTNIFTVVADCTEIKKVTKMYANYSSNKETWVLSSGTLFYPVKCYITGNVIVAKLIQSLISGTITRCCRCLIEYLFCCILLA